MLTPLAFDPGHPFPYISNRSRNLAVVVRHRHRIKFARVKVPHTLPRFIELPRDLTGADRSFVFLEDVVKANLQELFPGVEIVSAHLFRIIRDTDIVVREGETDDLLESVDRGLKRVRHGAVSLLEVERDMPAARAEYSDGEFRGRANDVAVVSHSRGSHGVRRLDGDRTRASARVEGRAPRPAHAVARRADSDVFEQLKYRTACCTTRSIHSPRSSDSSRLPSDDPHVIAIKMTLYRIARNSPLVDLLIKAADAGKQVAVLVELKARFDERSNIGWATRWKSRRARRVRAART